MKVNDACVALWRGCSQLLGMVGDWVMTFKTSLPLTMEVGGNVLIQQLPLPHFDCELNIRAWSPSQICVSTFTGAVLWAHRGKYI